VSEKLGIKTSEIVAIRKLVHSLKQSYLDLATRSKYTSIKTQTFNYLQK